MKKVTRNCEIVEYRVTLFDDDTEEISNSTYTDFESLTENDLKRALNSMLKAKGDARQVIKVKAVNATSGLREMTIADYVKYSTPVMKKAVDQNE